MSRGRLCIRVDAAVQLGWGHFMRCFAVAQAWRDRGGEVIVYSETLPAVLRSKLSTEGISVSQPNTTPQAAEWCLIDGYHLTSEERKRWQAAGYRLALFDDNGETGGTHADLIINYNAHACADLYPQSSAKLMLGMEFAPVRREFRLCHRRERHGKPQRLIVLFGGTDPTHGRERLIRVLLELNDDTLQTRMIVSDARERAEFQQLAGTSRFEFHTPPDDMANWMNWADVAISASGFSVYELLSLHIPVGATAVVENQQRLLQALVQRGAATDLNPVNLERLRTFLSQPPLVINPIVDGYGAERIVAGLG